MRTEHQQQQIPTAKRNAHTTPRIPRALVFAITGTAEERRDRVATRPKYHGRGWRNKIESTDRCDRQGSSGKSIIRRLILRQTVTRDRRWQANTLIQPPHASPIPAQPPIFRLPVLLRVGSRAHAEMRRRHESRLKPPRCRTRARAGPVPRADDGRTVQRTKKIVRPQRVWIAIVGIGIKWKGDPQNAIPFMPSSHVADSRRSRFGASAIFSPFFSRARCSSRQSIQCPMPMEASFLSLYRLNPSDHKGLSAKKHKIALLTIPSAAISKEDISFRFGYHIRRLSDRRTSKISGRVHHSPNGTDSPWSSSTALSNSRRLPGEGK
jgi:hypothetical protein